MFDGNGILQLEGDHLDLSYGNRDAWPNYTPAGSLKGLVFSMGDRTAGPLIQLGIVTTVEGEPLDWANVVDPPHYHGSDQFRLISRGEWNLANRTLPRGSYSFQQSGYVYREHPGSPETVWIMLVIGDRRGAKATLVRKQDMNRLIDIADDSFKPVQEGETYPHPAGPAGIAAIATSVGECDHGYLSGSIAQIGSNGASVTGLLGDEREGPAIHVLKYGPDQTVIPASVCATEQMLVVSSGSCRIGDREYHAGEMRVQRADAPMPAVISGAGGVEATLVVADRRHPPAMLDGAASPAPAWIAETDRVRLDLHPVPGGIRRTARVPQPD